MNAEDRFECRHQEIHDDNTGVTATFGTHAGGGHRWLRLAVMEPPSAGWLSGAGDHNPPKTRTSTVTFGPDGQVLKITPHIMTSGEVLDTADKDDTTAPEFPMEEDQADSSDKVDKTVRRGRK